MTESILFFQDIEMESTVILLVDGENVENLLNTCGREGRDWHPRLDADKLEAGLWIWNGEVTGAYFLQGEFRRLTIDELSNFNIGEVSI